MLREWCIRLHTFYLPKLIVTSLFTIGPPSYLFNINKIIIIKKLIMKINNEKLAMYD